MDLLQLLLGAMTQQSSVGSVSGKTGLSDKQVKKLMALAIPLLIRYMTKNASSGSGAQSLLGALSQHTDKKDMAQQLVDADEKDGGKIIQHILGNNQGQVTQELSEQTGLNASQISQVLAIMAPALMSGVSEAASTSAAASQKPGSSSPLSGLAGSGIFGALLGLGKEKENAGKGADQQKKDENAAMDGTALLQALLRAGK